MSLTIEGERLVITPDGEALEVVEQINETTIIEVIVPGPQGIPGPQGASGLEGYNHTQGSASATWTVAHNLGYRPVVDARNTGGAVILGEVLHLTVNTLHISFLSAVAGTARCV